ncbi:MAG: tRNA pseudouridine(13) synthase TruD [Anaerolineae bacterium]
MIEFLPACITEGLPGVGGLCRVNLEDFYVEEIPLYPPTGAGQHTLFEIEKRGIDTPGAMRVLARELDVSSREIGCAGLKDAHAISRQRLSVESIAPERLLAIKVPQLKVLWAERHRNRLKIGHLRGNRFVVRIRQVLPDSLERATAILDIIARRGLPNGYGLQRFGSRGQTHLLGRSLVLNDLEAFFRAYLGTPQPDDDPETRAARELYDAGDVPGALRLWHAPHSDEFRALRILCVQGSLNAAYYSLPRELLRLSLAAYQGYLFNRLLQQRLPHYDQMEDGDLAYKHDNGACFMVENAATEQPRADRLEISPTAPLYGHKVRLATGLPGERERALLATEGLALENLQPRAFALDGARRPLRVAVGDLDVSQDEEGLVVKFALPAGAYATNLLRELMKTPDVR